MREHLIQGDPMHAGLGVYNHGWPVRTSWGWSLRHQETSDQSQGGERTDGSAVTLSTPHALWNTGRTQSGSTGGLPCPGHHHHSSSGLPLGPGCHAESMHWLTLHHSASAVAGWRLVLWPAFFHNTYSIFVGRYKKIPRRKQNKSVSSQE